MGFLGDAREVSVGTDCAPTRAREKAELRGLEAHSCRSNSESTLLHGEDYSLNPILSVEPFHRLVDVPIDGSV